jgi:hypothetical protein
MCIYICICIHISCHIVTDARLALKAKPAPCFRKQAAQFWWKGLIERDFVVIVPFRRNGNNAHSCHVYELNAICQRFSFHILRGDTRDQDMSHV